MLGVFFTVFPSPLPDWVGCFTALHIGFADRLDDHGDKVAYARDSFRRHDIDVQGLFEDLMTGEG
jgi:hypothetical protein